MDNVEFTPFPKISRLRRVAIVTEKIDGTNACIHISKDGAIRAGSRTRWITLEDDNFGFARWVHEHAEELSGLGPGTYFGEWWGIGIQRRYDLKEKRFSLFNVGRWNEVTPPPACCHVVPVLYAGPFCLSAIDACIRLLAEEGSRAAPGFMRPEGVVVYHTASGHLYKQTIEKDSEPKSKETAT